MARNLPDTSQYLDEFDRLAYGVLTGAVAQAVTGATCAVAITYIKATDIVLAQVCTAATVAYITTITITASTGFVLSLHTSPGVGTFSYIVLRPYSSSRM